MTFNYREIFSIAGTSFLMAFKWKFWKWLLVGSVGSLLGLLKIGKDFFELTPKDSAAFGVIAIIILFVIRFILIFINQTLKYFHEVYKNSTYGDAIVLLKDSFASAHHYRKSPGHRDEEFMKLMILLCNNLKTAFDKILKTECSVSIKVPLSDSKVDEKTILMNLTRDHKNGKRDTKTYTNIKHTLIGNTAFSSAFNKVIKNSKDKYYMNNSIHTAQNYDNTSKECYEDGVLPYKSELVYPIIPIKDSIGNIDCHGFICVDCQIENAFTGKYDVAILEGVADGIYDIISARNTFKYSKNEQKQSA